MCILLIKLMLIRLANQKPISNTCHYWYFINNGFKLQMSAMDAMIY